jgi:hypothetical protein
LIENAYIEVYLFTIIDVTLCRLWHLCAVPCLLVKLGDIVLGTGSFSRKTASLLAYLVTLSMRLKVLAAVKNLMLFWILKPCGLAARLKVPELQV